jgi:hypothetical protein
VRSTSCPSSKPFSPSTTARAAVPAGADPEARLEAGHAECRRQRAQLPVQIRDLVLDDQRLRNEYCWFVFTC